MPNRKTRSGDFLSDLEIVLSVRSSELQPSDLRKLLQDIMSSVSTLVDTELAVVSLNEKQIIVSGRNLTTIGYTIRLK